MGWVPDCCFGSDGSGHHPGLGPGVGTGSWLRMQRWHTMADSWQVSVPGFPRWFSGLRVRFGYGFGSDPYWPVASGFPWGSVDLSITVGLGLHPEPGDS